MEESTNQYLGLTIGPVLKTLKQARKTRELWAASFMLSHLMEQLVDALNRSEFEIKEKGRETTKKISLAESSKILLPVIPEEIKKGPLFGAGIYPDRLFMRANGFTEEIIKAAIDQAIDKLVESTLLKKEYKNDARRKDAHAFWKQYFRIRWVLLDLSDSEIKNGGLSQALTPLLENQELEDVFFPVEQKPNEWDVLFGDISKKKKTIIEENGIPKQVEVDVSKCKLYQTPLSKHLMGENEGVYDKIIDDSSLFPATNEVATFELYEQGGNAMFKLKKEDDKDKREVKYKDAPDFYTKLNADLAIKDLLLPRHRYFCLVQADGDGIGQVIKQLDSEDDYVKFSKFLSGFGKNAAEKINKYGGKPIYIGGDDLLFLAPLNNGSYNLLGLIRALDEAFKEDLKKLDLSNNQAEKKGEKLPYDEINLSYGINIAYHKFPLFEAIEDAYDLLLESKRYKNKAGKKKNAITFQLTKHSGTTLKATFSKYKDESGEEGGFFDTLITVIHNFQKWEKAEKDEKRKFFSSLIFKVLQLKALFQSLPTHISKHKGSKAAMEASLKIRFKAILENFFNEWDADNTKQNQQKDDVADLIFAAFKEQGGFPVSSDGNDLEVDQLEPWLALYYASMRLLDFMNETIKSNA